MTALRRSAFAARWPLLLATLSLGLAGCSPRLLLVERLADELARPQTAEEDDLLLVRDAAAFQLKLSEAVLAQTPGHLPLAEAVAGGFTQYAYAFVAAEADRTEARDVRAAQRQRERARKLYRRAQRHAMAALEATSPGFGAALRAAAPAAPPQLGVAQVGTAYWAAAAWAAAISLSKDDPDAVADLPLAQRLALLAFERDPDHGAGALASLLGTLEAARPGGSAQRAVTYFEQAERAAGGRNAGVFVARAEALALPAGDRAGFEALLRRALAAGTEPPDLGNQVMQERARWLLGQLDELF